MICSSQTSIKVLVTEAPTGTTEGYFMKPALPQGRTTISSFSNTNRTRELLLLVPQLPAPSVYMWEKGGRMFPWLATSVSQSDKEPLVFTSSSFKSVELARHNDLERGLLEDLILKPSRNTRLPYQENMERKMLPSNHDHQDLGRLGRPSRDMRYDILFDKLVLQSVPDKKSEQLL